MRFLTLLFTAVPLFTQTNWQVVKTFQIGGSGGWDYLIVDSQTHRLYVPRTTHTLVIDGESGKTLADIPGQKNAHGVAIAPAAGRGFISDGGGDGAIVVFDLKTYAVLGSLPALPDVDGIIFDAADRHVGEHLAVPGAHDDQLLRSAASDEEASGSGFDGHSDGLPTGGDWPVGDNLPGLEIDDSYFVGVHQIDINLARAVGC